MNVDQIRKILRNKNDLHNIVEVIVDQYFESQESRNERDAQIKEILVYQATSILNKNIIVIEKTQESEIEKLFLNALNIASFLCGLEHFITFIPSPHYSVSALNYVQSFRSRHKEIEDLYQSFKKQFPEKSSKDFLTYLEQSNEYTRDGIMTIATHMILYRGFMGNAFHMIPQASFPEIRLNKKGIRVDGFLWIPSCPEIKIIIECDGYKWHSNKQSFINDRKRDRLLKSIGCDVLRYSGTEIWNEPIQCGIELAQYLINVHNSIEF